MPGVCYAASCSDAGRPATVAVGAAAPTRRRRAARTRPPSRGCPCSFSSPRSPWLTRRSSRSRFPRSWASLVRRSKEAATVLGAYTAALAVALPGGEALRRRAGARVTAAAGLMVFAAASLACGLVGSVVALLVLRGVQAVGAAAVLVAAFELVDAGRRGRRVWAAAAIFGIAIGPALGGALTQRLDWRAIFSRRRRSPCSPSRRWRGGPTLRRRHRRRRPCRCVPPSRSRSCRPR